MSATELPRVLVTGAGGGIGRATVLALLQQGRRVLGWDLVAADLDAVRRAAPAPERLQCDVVDAGDAPAVGAALARAADDGRLPGALVTCAGPSSAASREFDDGVLAVLRCAQVPTAAWLSRPDLPTEPCVAHVVSIAGTIVAGEGPDWYAAGKAAVLGYSRWLARHRPRGVRSNAVAPALVSTARMNAWIDSPGVQAALTRNPMGAPARPDDVAAVLAFLTSPAAAYLNGLLLPVDGGLTVS